MFFWLLYFIFLKQGLDFMGENIVFLLGLSFLKSNSESWISSAFWPGPGTGLNMDTISRTEIGYSTWL